VSETIRSKEGIDFEVFEPRRVFRKKEPRVSITRNGIFSINVSGIEEINNPTAVELLYSASERIIGIRPVDPSSPRAMKLARQGGGNTYNISGRSFLNYYDIPYETAKRYPARVSGNMLLVDLKEGGVEVSPSRMKSREES
jgi:hypothetical protein